MYDDYVAPHRRSLRKYAADAASAATKLVEDKRRAEKELIEAQKTRAAKIERATKGLKGKELEEALKKWDVAPDTGVDRATKNVDSYSKAYSRALALAENPNLDTKYLGKTKEEVQKMLGGKKLTGAELNRIQASQLTAGQNLKALGSQLKNQSYTPKAMVQRGWENLGEGGGGYAGGTRIGRHNLLGGKTLAGVFALGDAKDAFNKSDPTGQGRSRTERVGYAAGGALGSVLGTIGAAKAARIPGGGVGNLLAQAAAGIGGMVGGYYAGGKAGKYIDKGVSSARGVTAGDYKQDLIRRTGLPPKKDGTY